jgi:hypothetical protein
LRDVARAFAAGESVVVTTMKQTMKPNNDASGAHVRVGGTEEHR